MRYYTTEYYTMIRSINPHIPAWRVWQYVKGLEN
jgi:hypothetical protein